MINNDNLGFGGEGGDEQSLGVSFVILSDTFSNQGGNFSILFLQTIPELPAMDIWQSSSGKKCNFTTSVENHMIAISDFFYDFWSGTATV